MVMSEPSSLEQTRGQDASLLTDLLSNGNRRHPFHSQTSLDQTRTELACRHLLLIYMLLGLRSSNSSKMHRARTRPFARHRLNNKQLTSHVQPHRHKARQPPRAIPQLQTAEHLLVSSHLALPSFYKSPMAAHQSMAYLPSIPTSNHQSPKTNAHPA